MKQRNQTKDKIIAASWELFSKQGYEATTIDNIISLAGISRGTFYHHFSGKEELLFTMAYLFDDSYENWENSLSSDMDAREKLLSFTAYSLKAVEFSPYKSFLAELYGLEVMTQFERFILNPARYYYGVATRLISECKAAGHIDSSYSTEELVKWYTMLKRGLTYNWLLMKYQFSLSEYGETMVTFFLNGLKNK